MSNEWLPRQKLFSALGSRHVSKFSAALLIRPSAPGCAPANQPNIRRHAMSFFRDGVTSISRSRHHAPPGRELERPAWTFKARTLSVFGGRHRRAAEIGGYQHAVR